MATFLPVTISPTLPWDAQPGENRRLYILIILMLLLALLIMIGVTFIKVPEVKRAEAEAVPERLAKLVVEQKAAPLPKPAPKPKEVPLDAAQAKKPKTTTTPSTATPPADAALDNAPKAVATNLQKSAARARASKVMQDEGFDALSDLRDMNAPTAALPTTGLPGQTGTGTGGNATNVPPAEAGTSRNVLTARAGSGSGVGAYAGGMSEGFGGGKAGGKGSSGMLRGGGGGGGLQSVSSNIGAGTATNVTASLDKNGKAVRTAENIRKTFEANHGRLYNLYQRALNDDPTLQGAMTIKLVIAPDGSVTSAAVSSDQLNNPELEAKVIAIVKGFNFGAENVAVWSGVHTLNFLPQN